MDNLPQPITIADIVRENRRALKDGTLFALSRKVSGANMCVYAEHGVRCSIGVVIQDHAMEAVLQGGLNHSSVDRLVRRGIIAFPEPDAKAIAAQTQRLHDAWAAQVVVDASAILPDKAQAFALEHSVGSRENFEAWLDFLDREYLQGQSSAQSAPSGGGGIGPCVSGEVVSVLP